MSKAFDFNFLANYTCNTGESIYYASLYDRFIHENFNGKSIHFEFFSRQDYDNLGQFVDMMVAFLEDAKYAASSEARAIVWNDDVFIRVSCDHNNVAHVTCQGNREVCLKVKNEFNNVDENRQIVQWYYARSNGSIDSIEFYLDKVNVAKDHYYPFLNEGIQKYFDRYHASDSQILILAGPPGTGKTSLIRTYLKTRKLKAMTTYDEDVMKTDEFYLDFMADTAMNALIVEDADALLLERESKGNKIMSKILNASDGIVKLSDKKIIFTTNIEKQKDIDQALLRPGRCFDYVNFRNLTAEEAKVVCTQESLDDITKKSSKSFYSLAEVFNQTYSVVPAQRIGML